MFKFRGNSSPFFGKHPTLIYQVDWGVAKNMAGSVLAPGAAFFAALQRRTTKALILSNGVLNGGSSKVVGHKSRNLMSTGVQPLEVHTHVSSWFPTK